MNQSKAAHLISFALLIPFLVLLIAHRLIGFSDALLMAATPWDRQSAVYNLGMVVVFHLGIIAFLVHAVYVYSVRGGRAWLSFKLLALAGYWLAIFVLFR